MPVDMLGAIIPKDISICLVVQEIARQIDHFTRELVDLRLFSVWHSLRVHYAATRTSFATITELTCLKALFTGFCMLDYVYRCIAVAEKSGGNSPWTGLLALSPV